MSWIRAHTAEIVVAALAVVIAAGVYTYAHLDTGTLEESKDRGAAIVSALEQHRAEHGTYPESLEALVPKYTARIDSPTWGLQRWRYTSYASRGDPATVYFQLSVARDERGYPVLYYDFTAKRWVLNQ